MEKPKWWSKVQDVSWDQVKGKLTTEWQKLSVDAQRLGKDVSENAIAFGHGARAAYGKAEVKAGELADKASAKADVWSDEVEKRLKVDWEQTHKDAGVAWDKVREAVKHGWEATVAGVDPNDKKS